MVPRPHLLKQWAVGSTAGSGIKPLWLDARALKDHDQYRRAVLDLGSLRTI